MRKIIPFIILPFFLTQDIFSVRKRKPAKPDTRLTTTRVFYRGKKVFLGKTVQGRPIPMYKFGYSRKPVVLVIGGVHGDEEQAILMVSDFTKHLLNSPTVIPTSYQLWTIPALNLDGQAADTRLNANNVDLNRNFGTRNWQRNTVVNNASFKDGGGKKPFSEPETQALKWLFTEYRKQIRMVINFHCCARVITGHPKSRIAMAMQKAFLDYAQYRVLKTSWSKAAYPVTGSLAQWHWEKFRIPDVFIELDKDVSDPYKSIRKAFWNMLEVKPLKNL